jgi:hypothetical protein
MQSMSIPNMMRLRRLRRGVVILLLALGLFDMAVIDLIDPQLCHDGFAPTTGAAHAQNASEKFDQNVPVKVAISHRGSLPRQDPHSDSSPASTEEDCFCCCSHILPSCQVNYMTLDTMPRIDIPLIDSLPAPPPQATFHPPRLV